ncbi:hypothetical protein SAMN05421823_105280 [Catalinimonas alkaloidigena]|uniref:MG2 domain-containing protein n=1 Tax=Catalinimonas alkaloidigena TaxID=1075417 RepID=A0A1G9JDX2_9BACT|nr:hypothetical protein [Catalinimonas alkaloidigena]SDL35416.1 hypothetical protein SAMN05421823_105280 [Catalinimonas alkaloidigena]
MRDVLRLILLGWLTSSALSYGQEAPPRAETVALEAAREWYLLGDSVWFVAGVAGGAEPRSQVVYVELISPNGQLIRRHQLTLEKGLCAGVFALPDTLPGAYQLRAFTRLMAQSAPPAVVRQTIWAFPPQTEHEFDPEVHVPDVTHLTLAPAGGLLLADRPTDVAFRVVGQASDLVLLDDSNQVRKAIEIPAGGLGTFALRPERDRHYRLRFQNGAQKMQYVTLPPVRTEGMLVWLDTLTPQGLQARLQRVGPPRSGTIALVQDEKTWHQQALAMSDSVTRVTLPTQGLPGGWYALIVRDSLGQEQSRHAVHLEEPAPLQITLNRPDYAPRGTVTGTVHAAGLAEVAVVVTELEREAPALPETPTLWPLLRPVDQAKATPPASAVATGTPEQEQAIRGRLVAEGTPLVARRVTLSVPGPLPEYEMTLTDAEGRFSFPVLAARPTIISAVAADEPGARLELEMDRLSVPVALEKPALQDTTGLGRWLAEARLRHQIHRVYFPDTAQPAADYRLRRPYERPTLVLPLDDYLSIASGEELIREAVMEVKVSTKKGERRLQALNPYSKMFYKPPPLLLIDGLPEDDPTRFLDMPARDMIAVEILRVPQSNLEMGTEGGYGVVAVYTRAGTYHPSRPELVRKLPWVGYAGPQVLPAPSLPATVPDLRATLYCRTLPLDAQGQATFSFPQADQPGRFQVQVFGVDAAGQWHEASTTYSVVFP